MWRHRAAIYNDLGLIKSELEQYDEALTYYQQSLGLKYEHEGANNKELASTYSNIGTLYYKQKRLDIAIENFQSRICSHFVQSYCHYS